VRRRRQQELFEMAGKLIGVTDSFSSAGGDGLAFELVGGFAKAASTLAEYMNFGKLYIPAELIVIDEEENVIYKDTMLFYKSEAVGKVCTKIYNKVLTANLSPDQYADKIIQLGAYAGTNFVLFDVQNTDLKSTGITLDTLTQQYAKRLTQSVHFREIKVIALVKYSLCWKGCRAMALERVVNRLLTPKSTNMTLCSAMADRNASCTFPVNYSKCGSALSEVSVGPMISSTDMQLASVPSNTIRWNLKVVGDSVHFYDDAELHTSYGEIQLLLPNGAVVSETKNVTLIGATRYAKDPNTYVLCIAIQHGDGPIFIAEYTIVVATQADEKHAIVLDFTHKLPAVKKPTFIKDGSSIFIANTPTTWIHYDVNLKVCDNPRPGNILLASGAHFLLKQSNGTIQLYDGAFSNDVAKEEYVGLTYVGGVVADDGFCALFVDRVIIVADENLYTQMIPTGILIEASVVEACEEPYCLRTWKPLVNENQHEVVMFSYSASNITIEACSVIQGVAVEDIPNWYKHNLPLTCVGNHPANILAQAKECTIAEHDMKCYINLRPNFFYNGPLLNQAIESGDCSNIDEVFTFATTYTVKQLENLICQREGVLTKGDVRYLNVGPASVVGNYREVSPEKVAYCLLGRLHYDLNSVAKSFVFNQTKEFFVAKDALLLSDPTIRIRVRIDGVSPTGSVDVNVHTDGSTLVTDNGTKVGALIQTSVALVGNRLRVYADDMTIPRTNGGLVTSDDGKTKILRTFENSSLQEYIVNATTNSTETFVGNNLEAVVNDEMGRAEYLVKALKHSYIQDATNATEGEMRYDEVYPEGTFEDCKTELSVTTTAIEAINHWLDRWASQMLELNSESLRVDRKGIETGITSTFKERMATVANNTTLLQTMLTQFAKTKLTSVQLTLIESIKRVFCYEPIGPLCAAFLGIDLGPTGAAVNAEVGAGAAVNAEVGAGAAVNALDAALTFTPTAAGEYGLRFRKDNRENAGFSNIVQEAGDAEKGHLLTAELISTWANANFAGWLYPDSKIVQSGKRCILPNHTFSKESGDKSRDEHLSECPGEKPRIDLEDIVDRFQDQVAYIDALASTVKCPYSPGGGTADVIFDARNRAYAILLEAPSAWSLVQPLTVIVAGHTTPTLMHVEGYYVKSTRFDSAAASIVHDVRQVIRDQFQFKDKDELLVANPEAFAVAMVNQALITAATQDYGRMFKDREAVRHALQAKATAVYSLVQALAQTVSKQFKNTKVSFSSK
jgi:hypothetical protein